MNLHWHCEKSHCPNEGGASLFTQPKPEKAFLALRQAAESAD
jgi:hypothetical protein